MEYQAFLNGDSKMSASIRNVKWSDNAIGNTAEWPIALKQSTGLILDLDFPALICWGSGLHPFI
ncbi:Uncharacterised protein [Chryseobacterium indoltheticum]|uniref:Uncharacterized protein n=1 Tax=Chryseobacterium indoltheticum TaxID=254 RepID=A0A381FHP1_9FLAO|nr:Uncharacterised protein [Chryseobacterium indoltheticum]